MDGHGGGELRRTKYVDFGSAENDNQFGYWYRSILSHSQICSLKKSNAKELLLLKPTVVANAQLSSRFLTVVSYGK